MHQWDQSICIWLYIYVSTHNQIKCYCVWSFFERKLLCVHYWWGREEKGVSYRLRFVSSARKQQSNTNLFHLHYNHLLLSRYISSSPCCQSAPVFNFQRSICLVWPLTNWIKTIIKILTWRRNPPLNTPALPCIDIWMFCKIYNYYFMLNVPASHSCTWVPSLSKRTFSTWPINWVWAYSCQ